MPSPGGLRARACVACLFALAAACGGGDLRQPRGCRNDNDCGSAGVCVASICAADTAPSAVITGAPSAPAIAGAQLVLDGGGSLDPDPGDSIASYAWTVSGGDCPPIPAASSQPRLDSVFGCAGSYTVSLVVTDSRGQASLPQSVAVTVANGTAAGGAGASSSSTVDLPPPTVVAADDFAVEHACQGSPSICTPVAANGSEILRLTSSGKDVFGAPVGYHWSYEPPLELNGLPAPKLEFLAGTDAAEVEVRISTQGTPLSGVWRFFVTATDARNKKARDELVVTVKDRPVLVSGGEQLTLPHRYDPGSQRYVAEGLAPLAWNEPDGDPVQIASRLESALPSSCALTGTPEAAGMRFRLECPTLLELAGAEAKNVLVFTGTDPAGNSAVARFALSVSDQPPAVSSDQTAPATPGHRYDAATRRYSAEFTVQVSSSDPEGDPVTLSWSHEAARPNGCSLTPAASGSQVTLRLECADLAELASSDMQHVAVLTASDGVGPSSTVRLPFSPQDLPPVISLGSAVSLDHAYDPARQLYTASFTTPLSWSDPEGDPLRLTWSDEASRPNGCTLLSDVDGGGTARVQLECADPLELLGGVTHTLVATASDGGGRSAAARFPLLIGDRPPVITAAPSVAVDHRAELTGSPRYLAEGLHPVQAVDPDGDPLSIEIQVTADASWAPHATASISGDAFQAQVPLAYPGELRRADGSSPFTLVAVARDPWQATEARAPVLVKDRPPVLTTASPTLLSVLHHYDGTGYRTDPAIASGMWVDPDGDPLQVTATSSGLCNRLALASSGGSWQVTAACDLAYSAGQGGVPPLASFARQHVSAYAIRDPWGQAGTGAVTISVLNRAPTGSLYLGACRPQAVACTRITQFFHIDMWTGYAAPSFTGIPLGIDPDEDPLRVTWVATRPDLASGLANPTCGAVQGTAATCASGVACAATSLVGCEGQVANADCQAEVAGVAGVEITDGVAGVSVAAALPGCP